MPPPFSNFFLSSQIATNGLYCKHVFHAACPAETPGKGPTAERLLSFVAHSADTHPYVTNYYYIFGFTNNSSI